MNSRLQKINKKKEYFEYFLSLLFNWNSKIGSKESLTKLRLQKMLFLASTVNATKEHHPLLDLFDRFYALPYGPVEMDIYESMQLNNFRYYKFENNDCVSKNKEEVYSDLNMTIKDEIKSAVQSLKNMKVNYLTMPVFDLVNITHNWTVWQRSMYIARLLSSRKERMSTDAILTSENKFFG